MNLRPDRLSSIAAGLFAVLFLAGCATQGGAIGPVDAPSASSGPTAAAPDAPGPTAAAPVAPGPVEPGEAGRSNDPAGDLTNPQPGQLDVHPVAAELLELEIQGRRVTIRVTWTSGVKPCYVLDSIGVERSGTTIAVTLREGHAPGDNVCIEIARQKRALVDLGELDPGTYTIADAMGGAAPIEVVVD